MRQSTKKIVSVLIFLFSIVNLFYAESVEAEPYGNDEFPQWAKDIRRTEIVMFGSLPFTTLLVSLGYGAYMYNTNQVEDFPSPFNLSIYTEEQQKNLFLISLGVSAGIGLTDLTVNLIKRSSIEFVVRRQKASQNVTVIPIPEQKTQDETNDDSDTVEEN